MDISIDINNFNFNLRVCAIIYNKDKTKILINGMTGRNFYILPGGRVKLGEDSESAIEREIREELGWKLKYKFKYFSENFLNSVDKNAHQICVCYETIYDGDIADSIKGLDSDFNTYYWMDINNINKYNIKPKLSLDNIDNVRLVTYEN